MIRTASFPASTRVGVSSGRLEDRLVIERQHHSFQMAQGVSRFGGHGRYQTREESRVRAVGAVRSSTRVRVLIAEMRTFLNLIQEERDLAVLVRVYRRLQDNVSFRKPSLRLQ